MKAILLSICALLFVCAVAYAQSVSLQDVCAGQYQHKSVALPTTAATPTAKLIAGATGTTIYVCALHVTALAAGATPALTFYTGTGTTCGTGTSQLGQYGQSGTAGVEKDIGSGSTTLFNSATGSDLCLTAVPAQTILGTVEYVQK